MIKVMIERQTKAGQDPTIMLLELRIATAMHQEGFISGEALVNTEDSTNIITTSTWQTLQDWERWANSETRAKLYQRTAPLLRGKPKVRIFEVIETPPEADH